MIVLLDSKDDFVREVACNVLGRSGGKLAAPHLLRMLDDPRMMVRRAAGFGLAFLKDLTSLPALRQRMERHKHDDTNVVAALQCALSSLEGNADPSQQGVGKPDFIAEYQTTSYNRLSAPDSDLVKMSAERLAEVLFLPSFHPKTLLQVSLRKTGTLLRMATMTSSIWYFEQDAAKALHIRPNKTEPTLTVPDVLQDIHDVHAADASEFWKAIDDLRRTEFPLLVLSASTGCRFVGYIERARRNRPSRPGGRAPTRHRVDLSASFTILLGK